MKKPKNTRDYGKQHFADGGLVEAKKRLGKGLKERADYLDEAGEQGIMYRDRAEASLDAASRGDYDATGTYKPWDPRRGKK